MVLGWLIHILMDPDKTISSLHLAVLVISSKFEIVSWLDTKAYLFSVLPPIASTVEKMCSTLRSKLISGDKRQRIGSTSRAAFKHPKGSQETVNFWVAHLRCFRILILFIL